MRARDRAPQLPRELGRAGHQASPTVKAQHHAGMPFDSSGHIDFRDVTAHPCVLIISLVNDSCTERVADLGIRARQCVGKADSKG